MAIDPGYIDSMRPARSRLQKASGRRWGWLFGVPCLITAAAAAWFKNERLIDVAIVLFGVACLVNASDGIRTGAIHGRWGETYQKATDPGMFWFCVTVNVAIGVAMLLSILIRAIAALT